MSYNLTKEGPLTSTCQETFFLVDYNREISRESITPYSLSS